MSDFNGIQINKIGGGLGRRNPSKDGVCGLIIGGDATDYYNHEEVAKLIQLSDAEVLGIDAAYDANNELLVYHHISEFFRLNPNGTLYLMLADRSYDLYEILATGLLQVLVKSDVANREIKIVAIGSASPGPSEFSASLAQLFSDVSGSISAYQQAIDELRLDNIYIDSVILEGRIFLTPIISSLPDLRTFDSPNVSVVIAQDPAIVEINTFAYRKYAAIGSALGMLSVRKVHENLGSVDIIEKPDIAKGNENYPLTFQAKGLWLTANYANVSINSLTQAEKTALKEKGYIFGGGYEGYPYIYFNSSPTCTELADDFSFIERNRTWNKAARYVIETLTPKINSVVEIDSNSGYIKSSTIASWEAAAKAKLNYMLADGEVAEIDVYIDPKQNVLSGSPVVVKISVTPNGIAEAITVDLGFKNPFA